LDLNKNNGNYSVSLLNKLKKTDYIDNLFLITKDEFNKLKTKTSK